MNSKKILVISPNGFSNIGFNKTYESIFSAFEKNNLVSLFTRFQDADIDYNYCSSYYCVSEADIINRLLFRIKNCGCELCKTQKNNHNIKTYNSFKNKKIKHIEILRDMLWKTKLWNNVYFRKWCVKTQADLIFFHSPSFGGLHEVAWFVSKYLNIPMVSYFTDDYLIYPKYKTIFGKIQQFRRKHFFKKTIYKSCMNFCVGELMAKEYSLYFGKKFDHIMNSADISPFPSSSKYSSPFVVSYFGGLHLNRWKMLVRIVRILNDNILLRVYTSSELTEEIKKSFNNYHIEFCGCVVGDELYNARLKSDILLHVESDDEKNRAYTRLAISTKIPEYLISGRVVLGFGPEEVASMRLLSDNNIGIVISSDKSDDAIRDAFWAAFSNVDECENMRKRAYEYAKTHFDKSIISLSFKDKLLSCIRK